MIKSDVVTHIYTVCRFKGLKLLDISLDEYSTIVD